TARRAAPAYTFFPMRDTKHLAWRAALAAALMVSFYLFALAVTGVLVAIPWLLWSAARGALLKIDLICLVGAFLILKARLPRPARSDPPAPLLGPEKHPLLFPETRDPARRTGQEMPAEVYLTPDVNAWVAQRGGFMGVGSRRIMGLGLPLLQTLTLPEL